MTRTISTKYDLGDTVFFASRTTEAKQHPCPDCLGKKEWVATSPAGQEYEFPCPRCSARYSALEISLSYNQFVPNVQELTIGSVRTDSEAKDSPSYMCRETGVGSGSVYRESLLFDTREEALAAAKLECAKLNETVDWVVKQYTGSLEIYDYQLSNAMLKLAKDTDLKRRYDIQDICDGIEESEDISQAHEFIKAFKARGAA